MLLKTQRLTIRHIVAEDWKSIKDIWTDFNTSEYAQYDKPHITDDADVQSRIAKWASFNSGIEHMFFATRRLWVPSWVPSFTGSLLPWPFVWICPANA